MGWLTTLMTGGLNKVAGNKNPLVSALAGFPTFNPFSNRGGRPPINPADMNAANQYLGTFSAGDQANIRAGARDPYQMIDWYRNAQAAAPPQPTGAAPMFGGAPQAAPPPVEQPTDYAALEEERKRKQAQRANWAVNKPPVA